MNTECALAATKEVSVLAAVRRHQSRSERLHHWSRALLPKLRIGRNKMQPRGLTSPSSGRPKGRFAPFDPPLMSNVRRHQ